METRKMIVGLSGLAGSGKDQSAAFLVEDFGFVKISLADPLKQIARRVYDFSDEQLWGPSQFRNGEDRRYPRADGSFLTPREALQKLGTEWGRSCYENTWAEMGVRTAQALLSSPHYRYTQKEGLQEIEADPKLDLVPAGVAIPDVRFKNEIAAIKAAGGKVVRIVRPGAGLGGSAGLHPSEVEQASIPDSEFDYVIQNDGTLEELRMKVHRIVR